ncbi:MAG: hypothetical protein V7700_04415, partial [Halioglobus sp.]
MKVDKDDSEFFRSLGKALLALVVSAIILMASFAIYCMTLSPEGANTSHSKTILGKQFKTIMGTTAITGDALEITDFKTHNDEKHALVTLKTTFSASNYPLLSYQFEDQHAGMRINLIWRTADNPRKLSTTPLHWNPNSSSMFNLAKLANWTGKITEIGVHIVGG